MNLGLGARTLHPGRSIDAAAARARRGSPDYGPQSGRSSRLLRIDQDEGDAAGLGAAIDPGVIGALLHQDVSRLQVNFRIVEQHVDLADSEIHLKAGDVLVQQGTNHAWVNRGTEPCRIAFVLVDAKEP